MKYQEIFVPGGFPQHTYNPRTELKLEQRLAEAKENLCKLVTVTGQTKSGKTVLAKMIFPTQETVWVDGGTVSATDDFWDNIIGQLNIFQSREEQSSNEVENTIGATAKAEANFLVVKGSGEVEAGIATTRGSSRTKTQTVSARVAALRGLQQSKVPLVIDDFHYIPREIQGGIVRALKPLIFNGLPVAIIAIPHRRYDALKVEKEMTGRISPIDIQVWSEAELRFIPETGFRLLNYRIPPTVSSRLASEAIGSPHLMQDFCRGICRLLNIEHQPEETELNISGSQVEDVFREVAETIGRPIFEKLARGPRQRSDRVQRHLKDGKVVDIYELVLHSLAHIKPGLVSVEYEDLRTAIRDISASSTSHQPGWFHCADQRCRANGTRRRILRY